jgi:hypothetical protein
MQVFQSVTPDIVVLLLNSVNGFRNGAGPCICCEAAVGGTHTFERESKAIVTGTLEDGGFELAINSIVLNSTGEFLLKTQTDYNLTLTATDQNFKGFLVRYAAA